MRQINEFKLLNYIIENLSRTKTLSVHHVIFRIADNQAASLVADNKFINKKTYAKL